MPSTRDLRRRLRSIRSTRQITKAMELVSTAKVRRASEASLASRPYARQLAAVLADLTRVLNRLGEEKGSSGEAILSQHPLVRPRSVTRVLAIAIASDRGLAGAYSTNILRAAIQFAKAQEQLHTTVEWITVGQRLEQGLLRVNQAPIQTYHQSMTVPSTRDIAPIARYALEAFLEGRYDRVVILYTEFHSLLKQEVRQLQLYPLAPALDTSTGTEPVGVTGGSFLYEPNPTAVLDRLLPRVAEVQLYQCFLEAVASEHAARRVAMQNATDNASSMLADLTLTYNSIRQSAITSELAEITSGASALAEATA